MRIRILRRILFAAILAMTPHVAGAATAATFDQFLDNYYADTAALDPVEVASNGDNDPRYDALWPDTISAEHHAAEAAVDARYAEQLGHFDRAALDRQRQISYDVVRWTIEIDREGLALPIDLMPINQFWGPVLTFGQLGAGASFHPFKTEQDYRNFISRADGFSRWVDTAIANMREGVRRGIVQPRVLMERCLPEYEPLMSDDAEKNVFFAPLKAIPATIPTDRQPALRADYLRCIHQVIIPAYARLHAFVKDEYLPRCRTTAGLGALPDGARVYRYFIRYWTTTDGDPEQIHQLGLAEVARIRGEMEEVRRQVGFAGKLPQFLEYVATDPRFAPFKTDQEVLDAYRKIQQRITPELPRLFGRLPKAKLEVRQTEAFRAAASSPEYVPGAADGSRPGVFYVPIVDPKQERDTRMEDLFLHEGIPGHHFQFSMVFEIPELPRFRRFTFNSAYVEGWALYAESLGSELGMYRDPYQKLGMLLNEMHRAVRLVVDTGLHAKGWTREQAMQYAAEQEGGSPAEQASAIERYMAVPAQALAYKIGQLKILALRHEAEQRLGGKFDIRAFHDEVLGAGSVPLSVLEADLHAWMAARAAAP